MSRYDQEGRIESRLRKGVERLGGRCLKLTSERGIPDRLVLLPHGRAVFVELKKPGGRLATVQRYQHKRLRGLGFPVYTLYNDTDVQDFLHHLEEEQHVR